MNIAIFSVTSGGRKLAARLACAFGDEAVLPAGGTTITTLREAWTSYDALICVMSTGIVVRAIAPLCCDKHTDPCVVVVDEGGRHAISLLSGHLGGGNLLAQRAAAILGGEAVITTASDILGRTALDLWVRENRLIIRSAPQKMTEAAAKLVNEGRIAFFCDCPCANLPEDFYQVPEVEQADIIVTNQNSLPYDRLCLSLENLVVGIGCNRGTSAEEIENAVDETCRIHDLYRKSITGCATIDLKIDEPGLLQFARTHRLPLHYFSKEQLNRVEGLEESPHAMAAVGARGVAEPAAMLATARGKKPGSLLVGKIKWKDVTTAVAVQNIVFRDC